MLGGCRGHVRTVWSMGTRVAKRDTSRITAFAERLRAAG